VAGVGIVPLVPAVGGVLVMGVCGVIHRASPIVRMQPGGECRMWNPQES
jgi:hypothetical protein